MSTATRLLLGLSACAAIASAAIFTWSCGDPVHDARVTRLGDEQASVPMGPTHRPGQPCLACHGGEGPADAELTIAGTIFQSAAAGSPGLAGATVTIFDAAQLADGGAPRTAVTNAAGNFFFRKEEWSPTYALHDISVTFNGVTSTMHTTIGRDGSCATCHFDPKSNASHGHIYLVLEPGDLPGAMP